MTKEMAITMRWHESWRVKDGVLSHLADSEAWKIFDMTYMDFSQILEK